MPTKVMWLDAWKVEYTEGKLKTRKMEDKEAKPVVPIKFLCKYKKNRTNRSVLSYSIIVP